MALKLSPDLTVYLTGPAAAFFAAGRTTESTRVTVEWLAAVAALAVVCAGACAAEAAGALARATAAATPNSAGAAAIGSRRAKRGRACFAGLPKGLLPEMRALTRKAACIGARVGHELQAALGAPDI